MSDPDGPDETDENGKRDQAEAELNDAPITEETFARREHALARLSHLLRFPDESA